MSRADVVAERDRVAAPFRAAGLPLLGLTVGTDGPMACGMPASGLRMAGSTRAPIATKSGWWVREFMSVNTRTTLTLLRGQSGWAGQLTRGGRNARQP